MTGWKPWSRVAEPGALLRYVCPDAVAGLLGREALAPSAEDPVVVLRRIYDLLAGRRVRYTHEPAGSGPAGQRLRPPDQVLARPGHGTCLDLAVVVAGACQHAGLAAMVVVVGGGGAGADHAFVVVRTRRDAPLRRAADAVLTEPDRDLLDGDVRPAPEGATALVAVDVALAAAHRPDGAEPATFEAAVAAGADLAAACTDGRRRWLVGVDVAAGYHPGRVEEPGPVPAFDVLTPPYHPIPIGAGPLARLKARNGVVPFVGRAELDRLLAWCQPAGGPPRAGSEPARVMVVYGEGGSGKTHLAAELARRLGDDGWYAGFLSEAAGNDEVDWLRGVVSPVLAVVDYAEEVDTARLLRLVTVLAGRPAGSPGWVLLTARAEVKGGWLDTLTRKMTGGGLPAPAPGLTLPRRHPRTTGVFRRAYSAIAGRLAPGDPPQVAHQRWTTLDLVMLAYLSAHGHGELPETRADLYDAILDEHELPYWHDAILERRKLEVPPDDLAQVGAVVTLFSPRRQDAGRLLAGVPALSDSALDRSNVAAALAELLPAEPGTRRLAVRPDPVGDHLALRELAGGGPAGEQLLVRCLGALTSRDDAETDEQYAERVTAELTVCYENLTRAAEEDRQRAQWLADTALGRWPQTWPVAFGVTLRQGGPFAAGLEHLAEAEHTPLPLDTLAGTIPVGHAALRRLALLVTERLLRTGTADLEARAATLNNLAVRQSAVGRREQALVTAGEAVTLRRQLVQASPGAFLPDLAGSLNNLANIESAVGQREQALVTAGEAVTHYRQLVQANPGAFLPDLARSLNNLAHLLAAGGRPDEALAVFETAAAALTPGARALLLAGRAAYRGATDVAGAREDLARAAAAADSDPHPPAAAAGRRAARAACGQLAAGRAADEDRHALPGWMWRPHPDQLVELANAWIGATDPARRRQLLADLLALASTAPGRADLEVLAALYADVPGVRRLAEIASDAAARGLDAALNDVMATEAALAALQEWLATPTWATSRRYLQERPQLLTDPVTLAALEANQHDPVMSRHLGIVRLAAGGMPLSDVYDLLTDPADAVDAAMALAERGEPGRLRDVFLAAPDLLAVPFAGPFLAGTLALLNQDEPTGTELLRTAAAQGDEPDRTAASALLARLARRRPDLAAPVTRAIGALTTEPASAPAADRDGGG
jgi:tetratricopeptide (TPR) repeat protein